MNETLLRSELILDEGSMPHAYQDHRGYWTIGVGRLIDRRLGGGLSQAEMEYLLQNDINKKCIQLDKYLPWWRTMSEARQRALCNMAFNLGVGPSEDDKYGKLLAFKNTLAAMERGDYEAAAKGMADSLWAKQVGPRAERLIRMMREG